MFPVTSAVPDRESPEKTSETFPLRQKARSWIKKTGDQGGLKQRDMPWATSPDPLIHRRPSHPVQVPVGALQTPDRIPLLAGAVLRWTEDSCARLPD